MRRGAFLALIGGLEAAPLTVRAQRSAGLRQIGMLSNSPADAQGESGLAAFQHALQQLGWSEGRNVPINVRWGENDPDRGCQYAAECSLVRTR